MHLRHLILYSRQRLTFLAAAAIFLNASAFAQTVNPGGVRGSVAWYLTDTSSSFPVWKERWTQRSVPLEGGRSELTWMNQHPALLFGSNTYLNLDLLSIGLNQATYFTVYQATDLSTERILWHLEKDNKVALVQTTSRVADLEDTSYMNFHDLHPLEPKVAWYAQQKQDTLIASKQRIQIGRLPLSPSLPIKSFSGAFPEIVVYGRVLDPTEQLRVASYLALKYGVTITEPGATYLNSSGEIIWDGTAYSDFHHSIAGIGRDDSSGLLQNVAASSNNSGLFKMTTESVFANKTFMLWGDNGLPLSMADRTLGAPPLLERKWLVVPSALSSPVDANLEIDAKQLDVDLPVQPVYWLAINRSGKEDFAGPDVEYKRMEKAERGKMLFKHLFLGRSSSPEMLAVAVGGNLLATSFVTLPSCHQPSSGKISLKVWGGQAPFNIDVTKDGKGFYHQIVQQDSLFLSAVSAGAYQISITDKNGNHYRDNYYINNEDGPLPVSIKIRYLLFEGQRLALDASEGLETGMTYLWEGPDNFSSQSPAVTLTNDGLYTVTVGKNGCTYRQEVKIVRPPKSIFKRVAVYPNPTPGPFTVKIVMDKIADVSLNIFTEDGRLILNRKLTGFAHYSVAEELGATGSYFLVFRSGLSRHTEKIIVIR